MTAKNREFDELAVGDTASFERIITEEDMARFAEVSGDHNPLHVDEDYAANTTMRGRVVYGMFLGALVSRLVGMELPGKRALLVKECMEFKLPARIGDSLVVKGTVTHKSEAARLIELAVEITRTPELLASGTVHVSVL